MQLPRQVPVMILPSVILFPQAMLPLYIFEPRYRQMLADVLDTHRMFSIAMQRPSCQRESPSRVAGLGLIRACVGNKDGTSNLILQGLTRVELGQVTQYKPYRVQKIKALTSDGGDSVAVDALTVKVRDLVSERLGLGLKLPVQVVKKLAELNNALDFDPSTNFPLDHIPTYLASLEDPDQVADIVSCMFLTIAEERQLILETVDIRARLQKLIRFLMAEIQCHKKSSNHE
jgi:ATP-dependent Lon protease